MYDSFNNCATYAGVLLLHNNPIYYLPGAYIQYIKTDSTERDLDKVKSDKVFKGALIHVLKEIDNFIKYNIVESRPVRIEGSFQDKQVYNYPQAALREFAMNAIMHRDYESNSPIYIYHFLDRIEINNNGSLYGISQIDFPEKNDYRNPVLAEAMKTLGYVNKFNFGIIDAQKKLKINGNPPAIFGTKNVGSFSVTIRINPEW